MKDLETKLRGLPLRVPSNELDERVMAQKPPRPASAAPSSWRLPMWAVAAVALVMAFMGFTVGAAWRGEPAVVVEQPPPPPVMVQVIYNSRSSPNPFDFTHTSDMFPGGELETTIRTEKGTGT